MTRPGNAQGEVDASRSLLEREWPVDAGRAVPEREWPVDAGRAVPEREWPVDAGRAVPERDAGRPLPLRERLIGALVDRLPLALRTVRLAPSRGAVAALAVVGLLAALAASLLALRARPHEVAAPAVPVVVTSSGPAGVHRAPSPRSGSVGLPGAGEAAAPGMAAGGPPSSPGALLVVDVVGSVRRPGIVRLPPGSRVVDALAAAGGLKSGASPGMINLAAPLLDGQQIVVGATGPVPVGVPPASAAPGDAGATGGGGAGGGAGPPGAGVVDLNAATAEQLDALPGVGPVLAQRIIEWRTSNGRFTSVEQLAEVGGIGERKLADLRPRVRV